MTNAYFVSDLHLRDSEDAKTLVFLRFLESLAENKDVTTRATHLFLVGDIFDLWVGGHDYFRKKFEKVVSAIRKVHDAGIEVHFFEGNHDLHLEIFWAQELGLKVHADSAYFQLAGQTVRVEHGDLINPDDRGYLFLRGLLRNPIVKTLALHLPGRLVTQIGERASGASREYTSTVKGLQKDEIRQLIRRHAEVVFKKKPFDLLISGHVHIRDDIELDIEGRKFRSVNLGSWFDAPGAFFISEAEARFIEL